MEGRPTGCPSLLMFCAAATTHCLLPRTRLPCTGCEACWLYYFVRLHVRAVVQHTPQAELCVYADGFLLAALSAFCTPHLGGQQRDCDALLVFTVSSCVVLWPFIYHCESHTAFL